MRAANLSPSQPGVCMSRVLYITLIPWAQRLSLPVVQVCLRLQLATFAGPIATLLLPCRACPRSRQMPLLLWMLPPLTG